MCTRAPGHVLKDTAAGTLPAKSRKDFNVAHASADIGTSDYEVSLRAGQHPLTADEGVAAGGQDQRPGAA